MNANTLRIQLNLGGSSPQHLPVEVIPAKEAGRGGLIGNFDSSGQAVFTGLPTGSHLVRCRLPNGGLLTRTAVMEQVGDTKVFLDADVYSPRETATWAYVMQSSRRKRPVNVLAQGIQDFGGPEGLSSTVKWHLWELMGGQHRHALQPLDAADQGDWHSQRGIGSSNAELFIPRPTETMRLEALDNESDFSSTFFLPPGVERVMILPDPADRAKGPVDSPWNVAIDFPNPQAMAVFGFMARGDFTAARQAGDGFVNTAIDLLGGKLQDFASALVGGYYLLQTQPWTDPSVKVGKRSLQDLLRWLANLDEWFPRSSDGAILHGTALLCLGHVNHAQERLLAAAQRGLPCFTWGARMLVDGLKTLQPEEPAPGHSINLALKEISPWVSSIDWDLPITTVRGRVLKDEATGIHELHPLTALTARGRASKQSRGAASD